MRQVKTTVTFEVVSDVGPAEEAALLSIFNQAQYNPSDAQEAGIRAASKVAHSASDDVKVDAVLGEGMAFAIEKLVAGGEFQRVVKISYAETAPKLPPPDEAKPQVIAVPKK